MIDVSDANSTVAEWRKRITGFTPKARWNRFVGYRGGRHVIITDPERVQAEDVGEGAKGVKIRWLIQQQDGAPNFAMRHFEVAPNGRTPHHSHNWEHEVFVLSGRGQIVGADNKETPLRQDTAVFVAPNEEHHFSNDGDELLVFLCLVPHVQK